MTFGLVYRLELWLQMRWLKMIMGQITDFKKDTVPMLDKLSTSLFQ
jgi:hypothetical protein